MATFKVLEGIHYEKDGTKYVKGDSVESDEPLNETFKRKFEKTAETSAQSKKEKKQKMEARKTLASEQSPEVDSDRSPGAVPPESVEAAHAQATEAEDTDEENGEDEEYEGYDIDELCECESELGDNVTDDFEDAALSSQLCVFKDGGTYKVASPDEPDTPVGKKSGYTTKKDVNAVLKKKS